MNRSFARLAIVLALGAAGCSGHEVHKGQDVVVTINACEGTAALPAEVGASCNQACGVYVCDGADALRCDVRGEPNACGVCGPLPVEECNGRDDDCDGKIDEECITRLGAAGSVRISGDRVVLGPGRDGPSMLLKGVDVVDLRSDEREHLTDAWVNDIAIDGEWTTWIEETERQWVLFARRRGEPQNRRISSETMVLVGGASIDAGRIVYAGYESGSGVESQRIWMWDSATDTTRTVTAGVDREVQPDLHGDWLAFERAKKGPYDLDRRIDAVDLRDGHEVHLSSSFKGSHLRPSVGKAAIVWSRVVGWQEEPRYLYYDAVAYDFASKYSRYFATRDAADVRIDEHRACFQQGGKGIIVYNFKTRRSMVISNTGNSHSCDISGRRVVWIEEGFDSGKSFAVIRELAD